jgi:drug/metabolite transporter (DMT)-like permease
MSDRAPTDPVDVRRGLLLLAFCAAMVSGVSVVINSYGVRAVPDATVYTTAKNLVAAIILLGFATALGRPTGAPAPSPRLRPAQLMGLGAVAVVGGSVPFVLFFEGLARASSSQASFIHKTLIIWVAALAIPLLHERLRGLHVIAIATLLAGQAVLAGGLVGFQFDRGEWLILGATLLWSVEVVLVKWLLRGVRARTVAVVRMAAGATLLIGWVVATGRLSVLAGLDTAGWMWAALTGVVLAGYVALWFSALALAPAVDVTAVLVVAVAVTGAVNAAVNGTAITGDTRTGILVVLIGAVIAVVAARTRSARARVTA